MPGLGGALPPKLRKTRAPSAMTTGDTMTGHGDAPPVPAAVPLPFGAAAKPPATFSAAGASSGGGAPSSIDEDEAKPAEPLAHAVLSRPMVGKRRSATRRRARSSSNSSVVAAAPLVSASMPPSVPPSVAEPEPVLVPVSIPASVLASASGSEPEHEAKPPTPAPAPAPASAPSPATAPATFQHLRGYLGSGNDMHTAMITVVEAKAWCEQHTPCAGFTFAADEPEPQGPVQVYFKSSSAFAPADHGWQTYLLN